MSEQLPCVHCDGTGVDVLEINADDGRAIEHDCPACGGTGKLGASKKDSREQGRSPRDRMARPKENR